MGIADEFREMVVSAQKRAGVGVRAFEKQLQLPVNSINSMVFGPKPKVPSIEKAERIAETLGWEFYIGPPRDRAPAPSLSRAEIPVIGFARCGLKGEGPTKPMEAAPAPEGAPLANSFYVVARGRSMQPEGIWNGDYALIVLDRPARPGDRVWIKDRHGLGMLKRLISEDDDHIFVRGWQDALTGPQDSYDDTMTKSFLVEVHPVAMVLDRRPGGRRTAASRPDPRLSEFFPATIPAARVATALGLDQRADEAAILNEIGRLRAARDTAKELTKRIAEAAKFIEGASK